MQHLYDLGIEYCEADGCNSTFGIAPAHSLKRRFILTKEQYFEAAYLCQPHHEELEFAGHEKMAAGIREIIERR